MNRDLYNAFLYNYSLYNSNLTFFNYYILNVDLESLKGKIIMKELVQKVFHPERLLNICNTYHIDFMDLMDIYS